MGLSYGIWFIIFNYSTYGIIPLLIISAIGIVNIVISILFVALLLKNFCLNCVNFSCPFNRVPKDVVDEYLKKNEVMRKAWEKSGWKIKN